MLAYAFVVHRFSLAWTRILPEGKAGSPVNPEGVAFYNSIINEMLAAGIEPVVTLCECIFIHESAGTLTAVLYLKET